MLASVPEYCTSKEAARVATLDGALWLVARVRGGSPPRLERDCDVSQFLIEDIGAYHSKLFTENFEACAVACCRRSGASPWPLAADCTRLPRNGTGTHDLLLEWHLATERRAAQAEQTYQPNRITEDGAIGLCATVFAALDEGEITEVAQVGSGVDCWVDDRRAVLEVSGIGPGSATSLAHRHSSKIRQLRRSTVHERREKPGYVFVMHFGQRQARLSYHERTGADHAS